MSYSIEFTFRGLAVSAEIEEYCGPTRDQPAEGGCCEDYGFDVEDIDEVLEHLELDEGIADAVRAHYQFYGVASRSLIEKLEREWGDDIREAATEFFWKDIGGPDGMKDYHYDG